MTDAPLRTPEEVLAAAIKEVCPLCRIGEAHKAEFCAAHKIRVLFSRLPPPDPRHEGLRERIKEWLDGTRGDGKGGRRELPGDLLRDCLVALSEPAAPHDCERWRREGDGCAVCKHSLAWNAPMPLSVQQRRCYYCGTEWSGPGWADFGAWQEGCKMKPAAPQPSADDVLAAVWEVWNSGKTAFRDYERAIRAAFAARRK